MDYRHGASLPNTLPFSSQYFTWADRTGGSYRPPQTDLDPLLEVLAQDKLDNGEVSGTIVEGKKDK